MHLFLSILLAGCAITPDTQQTSELTILESSLQVQQELSVLEEGVPPIERGEPDVFS